MLAGPIDRQASGLTHSGPIARASDFASGFPWVVTGIAILLIILALRKTPLKLSVEEVLEAREAASARQPDYLDAPAGRDGAESRLASVGRDDPALSRVESHRDLGRAISMLTSRERELLRLRFFEDLSQAKIAERMGISQMHVSRLLRQALERTQLVMTDPIRTDAGAHAGRLRAHGSLRLDHARRARRG